MGRLAAEAAVIIVASAAAQQKDDPDEVASETDPAGCIAVIPAAAAAKAETASAAAQNQNQENQIRTTTASCLAFTSTPTVCCCYITHVKSSKNFLYTPSYEHRLAIVSLISKKIQKSFLLLSLCSFGRRVRIIG